MSKENIKIKIKEYKNYKEMCEINNLKIKTGDAKKKQLEEISRQYVFEKVGNKLIFKRKKKNNIKNTIELTRNDLLEIFCCGENKITEIIKSNNFKEMLHNERYDLIEIHKNGNSFIYEVRECSLGAEEEMYRKWRKLARINKVKDIKSFTTYCMFRLCNKEVPRSFICLKSRLKLSTETTRRYDEILCKSGILIDLGIHYYRKNVNSDEYEEVTREYFNNWHIEREYDNEQRIELAKQLNNYEISSNKYELLVTRLDECCEEVKGWRVSAYHTYRLADNYKIIMESL